MTIEHLARRLGASLVFGGLGLFFAAVVSWSTVGDGGEVVRTIHTVAGSVMAVFGAVTLGIGLAISTAVPPQVTERPAPGGDA